MSSLVFKVEARLTDLPSTPLPLEPMLGELEDRLMAQFFEASSNSIRGERTRGVDNTLLRSLYGRYRRVPSSLTEDQRAMVCAALCITRYDELRRTIMDGSSGLDTPREDIIYYQMASEALLKWTHPSLTAVCK
jgi:hypothetical protein